MVESADDLHDSLDEQPAEEWEDDVVEGEEEIWGVQNLSEIGEEEVVESEEEIEGNINDVSDPEDLMTDAFSEDEAILSSEDEMPGVASRKVSWIWEKRLRQRMSRCCRLLEVMVSPLPLAQVHKPL